MPDTFVMADLPAGYGPPAPVQIIQREEEFTRLLDLYRQRKPERVLEVGTYQGGTLFHWLQNALSGTVVVSVDLYEDADNSHLYGDWAAPGVEWAVVRGCSSAPETAAQAAAYGPFDWVFIDAGHLEEEVRADWNRYRPLVSPGGIIAFHDILEYDTLPRVQVHRLWAELVAEYRTDEFTVDGGGGIGVVYMP